MLRSVTARRAAERRKSQSQSAEPASSEPKRWWSGNVDTSLHQAAPAAAPKGNAENADAFFEATADQPTQEDLVLDVLSDEQIAEIDTAWFTIDADRSGYL